MNEQIELRRALGLTAITIYAVGDILGAGIYALVGKVVAVSHGGAWLSFVVSAVIALFTGLTYAELAGRYPVAAGAAAYCRRAFPFPVIAFMVGILVMASGLSSAATVSLAFVGYLEVFAALPAIPASIGMLFLMSLINYAGIQESSRVNIVLTAIELSGLLLVAGVGLWFASGVSAAELGERLTPPADLSLILAGATVSFFAYIGFEDTVNVAEEVRDASRVLPRAILTAIVFTCVVYGLVTVAALATVAQDRLAASGKPLLEVLEVAGVGVPGGVFALVALFAICNTGLLNLIMTSRLAYGMAREGLLPAILTRVDPVRRTPSVGVAMAFVLAALLAVTGGVRVLAQTTSLLLLLVFITLHVGLLRVKWRDTARAESFRTALWTPVAGGLLCAVLASQYPFEVYLRASAVLVASGILYLPVAIRNAA